MRKVTVRKVGRTWNVFVDGVLVEGGFFHKEYAITAAEDWARQ